MEWSTSPLQHLKALCTIAVTLATFSMEQRQLYAELMEAGFTQVMNHGVKVSIYWMITHWQVFWMFCIFFKCIPVVDCGILTIPKNGRVTYITTTFESNATYNCDIGYTLIGPERRTCAAEGNWTHSEEPRCQSKHFIRCNRAWKLSIAKFCSHSQWLWCSSQPH